MQGRTAGFVLAALLLAAPLALLSAYGDGEGDEYGEGYGGAAGMDDYGGGGDDYGDYDAAGGDDSLSAPIRGVTELDDITFNKIVDGSRPVLVEFYAPDCTDCQELKIEMESLASSMGPHPDLLLAKIDGEANPVTADKFAKTYPTILFMGKGMSAEVYDGDLTADSLREFLVERVGEVGQLKALQSYIDAFNDPSNFGRRTEIIAETQSALAGLSPMESEQGVWYIKIMNNIVSKGNDYPSNEFSRLMRIVYDQADRKSVV